MRHTGKERLMEEWNRRGCSFSPPLLSQQQGAYSRGGCDDRLRLMRRDRTSSLSLLLVCDGVEPPSTSASFFFLPPFTSPFEGMANKSRDAGGNGALFLSDRVCVGPLCLCFI